MAELTSGQSPTMVVGQVSLVPWEQPNKITNYLPNLNFANVVKQQSCLSTIQFKTVTLFHGEPYLKWSEAEVAAMNIVENLQHAVLHIYFEPKSKNIFITWRNFCFWNRIAT